ncbi:MAG: HAMP domain-containing protein [Treponema sp.]|jgi:adenylate cyclase|nr:HAMP domain-containing protein [Treponema sp.]
MADHRIEQDVLDYGDFINGAGVTTNLTAPLKAEIPLVCNDVLDYGEFSCAEAPLPVAEQKTCAKAAAGQTPILEAALEVKPQESFEQNAAAKAAGEAKPDVYAEPASEMADKMSDQRHKACLTFPRMRAVFPIGAKLTACITGVTLCSLGLLTAAIWFFMGTDARRTAEKHNADVNDRVALTVETTLSSVKNTVSTLFYGLDQPNPETVASFFEEHSDIAAILFGGDASGGDEGRPFIHEQFFLNHGIDASLAGACLEQMDLNNKYPHTEAVLLNAAPFFERLPVLALLFPADRGWIAVFFSSERLGEHFGDSENASMLFNSRGEILIHADQDAIRRESNSPDFSTVSILGELAERGETALQTRYTNTSGDAYIAAIRRLSVNTSDDLFALTAIPEAAVFENINTITRLNLYLSLAAGLVVILFMRFFSKTISGPLNLIKSAVQDVEDGNYTMTENSRRDEIGALTESVNSMIQTLAHVDAFANQKIARRIWKGLLDTEGTRKEATVLFSSLCSFTENDESPEETVALFNDYLERMSACITITGGAVDKCIGATATVMAHWDAADAAGGAEQVAVNAICATLMMRAAMRTLNEARGGNKPVVRAGCGLNSGAVTAAQIGVSDRLEYTVMGDTVRLADHVKDFCESLGAEVIITEYTRDLIKDNFIIEELPPIIDKGKKIRLFAVVNVRKIALLERIFSDIEQMPKTNSYTGRLCLGPGAPQNMAELRKMLRLSAPDINKATHEEKKNYAIQTGD